MNGTVELYTGPMFSGKTEAAMKAARKAVKEGREVAFLYTSAAWWEKNQDRARSHGNESFPAKEVQSWGEILHIAADLPEGSLIILDEAHSISSEILQSLCTVLPIVYKHDVIVAGLDLDYLQRPFEGIMLVADMADEVHPLTADCTECGKPAPFTSRLEGGYGRIAAGAEELYAPRCEEHYTIPSE